MPYAVKQEIVLDRDFTPLWLQAIKDVSNDVANRIKLAMPNTSVIIRSTDENEQNNLISAVVEKHYLSLGRYFRAQQADRERYKITDQQLRF